MNKFLKAFFTSLIILKSVFVSALPASPYQIVICAVFQNETFFLKEWLDYHKLIGVEHFYLYNNLSTDNYTEILQPYIESGDVDLIEWPYEAHNQQEYLNLIQLPVYNQALELVKNKANWAAFIDLDEFILPIQHVNLKELLNDYTAFAGIAINWQVFGTSGINRLPEKGLIIEHLVYKAEEQSKFNKNVKMIVQPHLVKHIPHPHSFEFIEGHEPINTSKEFIKVNCGTEKILTDVLTINHYWFGTEDFFENHKKPRREKWGFTFNQKALKHLIMQCNAVYDDKILKFIDQLKHGDFP